MNKILIANRSEIASRIIQTCKYLEIKTVAIYSPEDKFASFVYDATESYPLTKSGIGGYLDQEEIIQIAKISNCDAIHPGYGFLSEMADFAQKVIDSGLIWIGPTPKQINLMGDKIQAKNLMQQINVPTIPGFEISANCDIANLKSKVAEIGYPILLKAALGGGGKAMRRVNNESEFESHFNAVKREAEYLFNSSSIFIEKYIENGRHIEVQIAGDPENIIHLFERDCSIQRRHQKVIEEATSTFVSQNCLEKIYETAVMAAKSINYKNLGTVEFIVTTSEQFYFLEMNTRLQVEHPVSEAISGIDFVALQIHLAEDNKLPYNQNEIQKHGHSIECRILAEDTNNNFAPSTGTIALLNLPKSNFVRIDHNLQEGMEITGSFDSMLAKVITSGRDRNETKLKMLQALDKLKIEGIDTNIEFLKSILKSKEFDKGKIFTNSLNNENFVSTLLENNKIESTDKNISNEELALIAAALIPHKQTHHENKNVSKTQSNWKNSSWK
ncbi:TPA: acetyl-CoA carboxylase biotin carboxylase subunit [Candidatus Dependentiae bacterium]|nr:acetyl-CoA carboxylase biotin carboxylase subunit [Candidatus Dependentiae bacterium]HBZ73745.1 acetyl-CoA carboxylase biotin carboxylase subunit [Candidatus Dependentiae bacterium]